MRFRSRLRKLAYRSAHPTHMHAAIVARGKAVLGYGANSGFHHAEENAIFSAKRVMGVSLRGSTLYTLMVRRKSGTVGNGSPCEGCMGAIGREGIKRVIVYV